MMPALSLIMLKPKTSYLVADPWCVTIAGDFFGLAVAQEESRVFVNVREGLRQCHVLRTIQAP